MQSPEQSFQQTLVSALTGAGLTAYDRVPQTADGSSSGAFPYVVVSQIDVLDGPTQGGSELLVTLHGWSRYAGTRELQQMARTIYATLHEQTLSITDFTAFYVSFESSEYLKDPDGRTEHGVFRYRALLDQTE